MHCCPDAQTISHAPQLVASTCRFTQPLEQTECPGGQSVQDPFRQIALPLHRVAHAPQFFGSDRSVTHDRLQFSVPAGQLARHVELPQT